MRIIVKAMVVCAVLVNWATGETFTYVDLVNRLTDLEHVAVLPQPGEKCAQWSSYDRKSKYDENTGEYLAWGANGDGTGFIRKENGKLVLAEMEGPGVIWRIWSAAPRKGHVRFYLDGNDQPAIDVPFEGLFNLKNKPFTREGLCYYASGGANCYVPIPYQKSCKVVADEDWGMYYHFTYTTYPKETRLPTFKRNLSSEESAALDKANKILTNCGADPAGKRPGEITEQKTVKLEPGQTATIVDIKGPRAITALKVNLDVPDTPGEFGVLRELALRMSWDNPQQPSVWSPLGDFFGTAPGVSFYRSLTLGMTEEEFYSYWYMPFGKRGLVQLTNDGSQIRKVTFTITHAPLTRPMRELGYFHAQWHRDQDLDPKRTVDWTMLKTRGRGRFCGVMLYIWNPRGGWWGEGDEKFFVDGEKFPSTFGTGSEDYFGYAWCSHKLFNKAYHNQTVSVNNNGCANPTPVKSGGHISNNRWQISDNVPFHKSFEGAIEKYFTNERLTRYSCVPYWYQSPIRPPQKPLASVQERLFIKEADEMLLHEFLLQAAGFAGSEDIEPLRVIYQQLKSNPHLADYYPEITLKMARLEKTAGHNDKAQQLIKPFIKPMAVPFIDREYAGDLMYLLDMPVSEAGKVKPFLVDNFDGSIKKVNKDGKWGIVTQLDQKKSYIYFVLPDEPTFRNIDRTVRFHVTCYSDGQPGRSFLVQYDSHKSPYQDSKEMVIPSDTPGWKTVSVECPRARFKGKQNGRSDFRIATTCTSDICIHDVRVEFLK